MGNAFWRPLYDLNYVESAEKSKDLTISTYAQVSQRTGQDWNEVQLTVSTARPALNQRLPDLKPWYIDSYVPPPVPAPREKSLGVAMSRQAVLADAAYAAGEVMVESEERIEAQIANATIQNQNAIVTYEVSGNCTVKSDDSPHKFFLGHFTPLVSLTYLAVPRHTDAVYRKIKIVNEGTGAAPGRTGNPLFQR